MAAVSAKLYTFVILIILNYNITAYPHFSFDEFKDSEMVRAGGFYRGKESFIRSFGGKNLRERDHLEDLGVNER